MGSLRNLLLVVCLCLLITTAAFAAKDDKKSKDKSSKDKSPKEKSSKDKSPKEKSSKEKSTQDKPKKSSCPTFLETCKKNINDKSCAKTIENDIVFGNVTTSGTCCTAVLKVGKLCLDGIAKKVLSDPKNKKNASAGKKRSEELWKSCLGPQPSKRFLAGCEKKQKKGKCGKIVGNDILLKKNVSTTKSKCCGFVKDLGKPCLDAMTKKILSQPKNKKDAAKGYKRSAEIWKTCSKK